MQKTRTILLSLAALACTGPLVAQQPKPVLRPAGQPPREPFLKDRGAPSTAPDTSGVITSMTLSVEVFALPEEDGNTLLGAPLDAATRYRRVSDLIKLGKARLEWINACTARSGARCVVDSEDMTGIPQDYLSGKGAAAAQLSPSLGMMGFGDHVEFEAILGTDTRTCNLNINAETSRLNGFREFHTAPKGPAQQGGVLEKSGVTTSLVIRTGEPILLGSMSRSPALAGREPEMRLAFARIGINKDRPEAAEPPVGAIGYVEQTLWFYSMERQTARDLLATDPKPGALHASVQELMKTKRARLEHTVLTPAQPGVKAMANENIVVRAPGPAAAAPESALGENSRIAGAKDLPSPAGLVTSKMPGLNTGFSADIGCEITPQDAALKGAPLTADLFADIWWRADLGLLQLNGATVEEPQRAAFEVRHLQTYARCYPDVPTFLGTVNPPRDTGMNGRKDDGRVWLCFVRVSPVRP